MFMLDKAMPIGNTQPLEIAEIERLPIITAVAINPVATVFEVVTKAFIC